MGLFTEPATTDSSDFNFFSRPDVILSKSSGSGSFAPLFLLPFMLSDMAHLIENGEAKMPLNAAPLIWTEPFCGHSHLYLPAGILCHNAFDKRCTRGPAGIQRADSFRSRLVHLVAVVRRDQLAA